MLRRALRILGIGVVVIAVSLYVYEFVASDYVTPNVTLPQWAALAVAVTMAIFLRNRDDVVNHHLPH